MNLANEPKYAATLAELGTILREAWQAARPMLHPVAVPVRP